MNLHAIVSGAIGAINPPTACLFRASAGYDIAPDRSQVPRYVDFPDVMCQVQTLSNTDLRKMDALNIQGIGNKIYLNGDANGVNRGEIKGGDLFIFPNGSVWLVTVVLENWPDWTACAVTQQNGG